VEISQYTNKPIVLVYSSYGYCDAPSEFDESTVYNYAQQTDPGNCDPYVQAAYSIMIGLGVVSRLFAFLILKLLN